MTSAEGGMGSLPSSRLTRLLQEKAEALRKRRLDADAESEKAEGLASSLSEIGVTLPETEPRREKILEWRRKSDWEAAENEAKEMLQYLERSAPSALREARNVLSARCDTLRALGSTRTGDLEAQLGTVRELSFEGELAPQVARLSEFRTLIATAEGDVAGGYRQRVLAVAAWAGVSDAERATIEERLNAMLLPSNGGLDPAALEQLPKAIPQLVPAAVEARERVRLEARGIVGLAGEVGFAAIDLEGALAADEAAPPTAWAETVPTVERAGESIQEELRARVLQAIGYLVTTVRSLEEHGADPAEPLARLEEIRIRSERAKVGELAKLVQEARNVAEDPVVATVAGLLDEVRSKLAEARELGRDTAEVFAAMNRAREALRLKIYSEALNAGVEAIDRVSQLTADLDAVRDEAEGLERLLGRLESLKLPTQTFRTALAEVGGHIALFKVEPARTALRGIVKGLGRESAKHFSAELLRLNGAVEVARQREFLPESALGELAEARRLLDAGSIPEAGELLASVDVQLRTAAAPYVARRVEEMRRGFEQVSDPALAVNTLRSLADADLALRVKDDFTESLESLRQAEREFSAVFAAESSALLEALDERERVLEEMGGAGSEFLRQTEEIQQIFDVGDFIRCARAAREFLSGTEGIQRGRADEAISHAKLALVELENLGIEMAELRHAFESAQHHVAAGRLVEGYRAATTALTEATRLGASAKGATTRLSQAKDRLLQLEGEGVDAVGFQEGLSAAERAFKSSDFTAVGEIVDRLDEQLTLAAMAARTRRIVEETSALLQDGIGMGVPSEELEAKLVEARGQLDAGGIGPALDLAEAAHARAIRALTPVLEENLRSVEEDYEVARRSGVEVGALSISLSEARRRLAGPVPLGVAERIESVRSQLSETRGFVEHAERGARRVEEAFGQAEMLKVATPVMRESVEALERSLLERQYARAIEISGPLEREILQATHQHVSRTLAGLQGMLVRSRQDGVPTAPAETILAKARAALQEGHAIEAIQLAAQSESEVERVALQSRVARGALDALEAKLKRFESDRIRTPKPAGMAAEARAAFEREEFVPALDLAFEAGELLSQARDMARRARDALEHAERQVVEAGSMGADATQAEAALSVTRELAESGEYALATIRARETSDLAWWAIERRYAGSLERTRELLGLVQRAGLSEAESVESALSDAEAAFQGKAWSRAEAALDRAQSIASATLERAIALRLAEIGRRHAAQGLTEAGEEERRRAWRVALEEAKSRQQYGAILEALTAEEALGRETARGELERRVDDLKNRLWVGERLGLDTTPAMERFGEARAALDQGRLESVASLVELGTASLTDLIRTGLSARLDSVETEMLFARDGLHVQLGDVEARVAAVREMVPDGNLVEAGRALLKIEEDLARRKSLHRELTNLHYLIEAGLRRATEARLNTDEARRRFEDSVREAARDYTSAITQARAALRLVEGLLKASEPPTAFWPFKRTT